MNVIERIHMLKKMVKEADRIVAWQEDIYTALHNIDAGWVVSGVFPIARGGTGLSTIAAGGILYASALDILSRLAPTAPNQVLRSTAANALQFAILLVADIPNLPASKITSGQFPLSRMPRAASGLFLEGNGVGSNPIFNALIAADIPNLPASKITSGRFPVDRLPAMTSGKIWKGTGENVEEVDFPVGVPSGVIVMWHGTIANIPSGWVICDGNNGTPNLLAKFVEGVATAGTNPGATGGAATHTLTVAELPSHDHAGVLNPSSVGYVAPGAVVSGTASSSWGMCNNTVTETGSRGGGGAHQNKPPFYDVAFIMKT